MHDESINETASALINVRQVAGMLAISERSVWRLSASGELPQPVRVGGATRWRRSEILGFVDGLGSRASAELPPHISQTSGKPDA